jgi:RNA polymerase sigma-70 factor, ECF subfamily
MRPVKVSQELDAVRSGGSARHRPRSSRWSGRSRCGVASVPALSSVMLASMSQGGCSVLQVSTADISPADETALLERARTGDETAFGELVGGYRAELHTHCYRMLGSVQDAEDTVQNVLLRAWRGLAGFEGRSSVRSWLYSIATNAALDNAQHRSRRELPVDFGPAATLGAEIDAPVSDPVWLEPYPDRWLPGGLAASPEARYEQRESVELAFLTALQYLPPLQRAVLILREVVGFSAAETAGQLGTTVASVTSALQRARATVAGRLPDRSQQSMLRELGDERLAGIARQYADAIERGDAGTLIGMLTKDATWSMPPVPTWFTGPEALRDWLVRDPLTERWRHWETRANGQLAVGCYLFDESTGRFAPGVIDVLTLDGDKIAAVTGFLMGFAGGTAPGRWSSGETVFPHFGLPAEL